MKVLFKYPIKNSMPVFSMISIAIFGVVVKFLITGIAFDQVKVEIDGELKHRLEVQKLSIETYLYNNEHKKLESDLNIIGMDNYVKDVVLFDKNLKVIASSGVSQSGNQEEVFSIYPYEFIKKLEFPDDRTVLIKQSDDSRWLVGFVSINYGLANEPGLFLISYDLEKRMDDIREVVNRSVLLFMGLIFILVLMILFLLSKIVVERINKIVSTLKKFSNGELNHKSELEGSDEISEISKMVDVMIANRSKEIENLRVSEQNQRELKQMLSGIIDAIQSVLIAIDSQKTIIYWNNEAAKECKLTSKDVIGKNLLDVCPVFRRVEKDFLESLGNTDMYKNDNVEIQKDGVICNYSIAVFPVVKEDKTDYIIRVDDITELIKMQKALAESEKIMVVGGLAAGMAHEINNPLAIVMQSSQVIQNRLSENLPKNTQTAEKLGISLEKVRNYLEKRDILKMLDSINEGCMRASTIVSSLLKFARKDGTTKIKQSINTIIENAVVHVLEYAGDKYSFLTLEILKEFENDCLVPLVEDEIEKVFINILKNSVEAIGDISKKKNKAKIVIGVVENEDYVKISIKDNGPGIDDKTVEHIFEPFYTNKENNGYAGLGLSIAYFIVKTNHGGQMDVFSEVGKGTELTVMLPRS